MTRSSHNFALLLSTLVLTLGACAEPVGATLTGSKASDTPSESDKPSERVPFVGRADAAAAHAFSIEFDYRFDTVGFFTVERRALLEAAAEVWEERLLDDFVEIPAGTPVAVKDPRDLDADTRVLELDAPIDDVLVFVACTNDLDLRESARTRTATLLTSRHGAEFRDALERRWYGQDYEPWTSSIAFGCDAPFFWDESLDSVDDIPNDQQDFSSTALHELGHVLGVGTSDAYRAHITSDGDEFLGPRTVEVFGGPLPLEPDAHVASRISFENTRVLMDDTLSARTRVLPSRLDMALLEDIGYRVVSEFR